MKMIAVTSLELAKGDRLSRHFTLFVPNAQFDGKAGGQLLVVTKRPTSGGMGEDCSCPWRGDYLAPQAID